MSSNICNTLIATTNIFLAHSAIEAVDRIFCPLEMKGNSPVHSELNFVPYEAAPDSLDRFGDGGLSTSPLAIA